MPENRWVAHIKKFAKDNNLSYGCAMTDPNIRNGYIPAPKKGKKGKKAVEFEKLEQAFPDTAPKAKNVVIRTRQELDDDADWENEQTLIGINKADAKKKAKKEKRKVRTGALKLLRKRGWQSYDDSRGEEVMYDNSVLLEFLEDWLAGGNGEDIIGDWQEREAIIDDWKQHQVFQKKAPAKAKKAPAKKDETAAEFNARIKKRWDSYTPEEQEEIRRREKAKAKKAPAKSPAKAPAKAQLSATDEKKLARAKQQLSQMDSMMSMGMMMDEDQRGEIEDTIRRLSGRGYSGGSFLTNMLSFAPALARAVEKSGGVVLPKGYDREFLRRTGDPLFL
jgi:hypothetical protein